MEDLEAEIQDSMDLRLLTRSQEHTPARSADLITEEMPEAFLPAGSRALPVDHMVAAVSKVGVAFTAVAASTEAVAVTAVVDIDNRISRV
jgi:hypothetical protein